MNPFRPLVSICKSYLRFYAHRSSQKSIFDGTVIYGQTIRFKGEGLGFGREVHSPTSLNNILAS